MYDAEARGSATPGGKQLKRKGKEVCVDDDFVEDVPKIPTVKKPKLPPTSTKQKTKKQSKELPKLVQKKKFGKDHFRFYLVESGNFESYPWGIKLFNQVMESVRHRLNPRVHSYLIRGCSLALQVWLYECCSTVSTELATRCSDSIPRILRWSATKGQIWLTAFEEKMIKPEWIKFTSMTESGEEIGVLTLPNKIEYEDEQGAQSSEVPNADSPTLEPKHTNCQEDKESVAMKFRKLEKGIKQLEDFRKDVFKELHDLRVFIDDSMKKVLNLINRRYDVDEAKFANSSTKNNDQKQGVNHQQFPFNLGDQVHASTSNTTAVCPEHVPVHVDLYGEFQEAAEVEQADIEDINAQSPIHGVIVAAQTEQVIEKQLNEGEDVHHVDEVVSEGSCIDKKRVTLDDFELPDNLTQLVKYGELIPDEATPIHPGRTRQLGEHARSPFIPLYSSGGSISIGPKFFYLKHPFTPLIGENVDSDMLDKFNKWLCHRTDKVSKRKKAPFSIKDNQINPWLDLRVEKVDKKDWFYSLAHPGESSMTRCSYFVDNCSYIVANSRFHFILQHIDVIMYYMRKREYILGYRLLANVSWDEVDYVIMPVNIVENFHWLLIVFDIVDMQLYVYDSIVSSHHHNVVESCVDKFSIIIPLYLSCTGFYGKRKDIDFKTTKAYIEKPVTDPLNIQWMVAEIPQQKEGSLDCGVFVAAFAEYVCIGDLSIPSEDLSDIDQHRRRYGALI
ncbi:uncharacterized protein LOC142174327 [Nicotiana tabacum]|uniref:Uncharacterized protein LOC142174327 n=1 Tax=Nicotiana tabacum TaxID=4097 RepID=A0AC58TG53_TOBAC